MSELEIKEVIKNLKTINLKTINLEYGDEDSDLKVCSDGEICIINKYDRIYIDQKDFSKLMFLLNRMEKLLNE
jgi:hypothetical protein